MKRALKTMRYKRSSLQRGSSLKTSSTQVFT
jgi:hypothetical protein